MVAIKKVKKKERVKLELLNYLCESEPELMIVELAEIIDETVEKTFAWIKVYNLPYFWKFTQKANH